MPRFKNISGMTQELIGFGVVEPDGVIESDEINNPNFELVEDKKAESKKGRE